MSTNERLMRVSAEPQKIIAIYEEYLESLMGDNEQKIFNQLFKMFKAFKEGNVLTPFVSFNYLKEIMK